MIVFPRTFRVSAFFLAFFGVGVVMLSVSAWAQSPSESTGYVVRGDYIVPNQNNDSADLREEVQRLIESGQAVPGSSGVTNPNAGGGGGYGGSGAGGSGGGSSLGDLSGIVKSIFEGMSGNLGSMMANMASSLLGNIQGEGDLKSITIQAVLENMGEMQSFIQKLVGGKTTGAQEGVLGSSMVNSALTAGTGALSTQGGFDNVIGPIGASQMNAVNKVMQSAQPGNYSALSAQ